MEIGATKAVQERLKATKISEIKETSLVFCWDTHLAKIKRRNVLFIVNASNRYTIAMTDIEPRNWNHYTLYISRVIHGVMQQMGYLEDQIEQYFRMSGDTIVTKTHSKKSVGGINRMVTDGFDAYGYPRELFKLDMERLGIVPKRKPAKVIDFKAYVHRK